MGGSKKKEKLDTRRCFYIIDDSRVGEGILAFLTQSGVEGWIEENLGVGETATVYEVRETKRHVCEVVAEPEIQWTEAKKP